MSLHAYTARPHEFAEILNSLPQEWLADPVSIPRYHMLTARYVNSARFVVVRDEVDNLAGAACWDDQWSLDVCYLRYGWVVPAFRSMGVPLLLLEEVRREARRRGLRAIFGDVPETSPLWPIVQNMGGVSSVGSVKDLYGPGHVHHVFRMIL